MKGYVTILSPDAPVDHEWNANEEGGQGSQHEAIRYSTEPITIKLTWANNTNSPRSYIGTYRLYLTNLRDDGYIINDSRSGYVRVKFLNVDGVIRIARGKKTKRYLVVGDLNNSARI